ncbi:MAG: hypothetical protein EOM52_04430, partial [Clostridia bacterium]|nr:hypothetical protein [Clostridia bacterium]
MRGRTFGPAVFLTAAFLLGAASLYAVSPPRAAAGVEPPLGVEAIPAPLSEPAADATVIMLDAGHGGAQTGACYFGAEERYITFDITMLLKPILEERGYQVLLTREGDDDIWLYDRASMANDAPADLFVSIHANVAEGHPEISGVMTYVQPGKEAGHTLGEAIHSRLLDATGGDDYGVQDEDLAVLRETAMPAALAEVGFMSNPDECERLTDPDYQAVLALAAGPDAEAVISYLQQRPQVTKIYHPSLVDHPGHEIAKRQQQGFGAMLSFEVDFDVEQLKQFLANLQLFCLAESLGGVESLVA